MKRQKPVPLATKLLVWSFSLLALVSCSEDQSLPEQRNVPQLLQAGAGDGQIALNWLEVTGAHTYTVYWSTEQAQHLNKYTGQAIRVNQNSYVHLGLNNGVTYRYVVTATTDEGESKESNLAEATPQRTPPAKPSSILSKGEDQRVTIRWSAVNRAQRYDLVWDTNSSLSTPKRIQNIQAPYVLTGLSNGRTVYFQLVAVNSGGEAYSDTSSVTPAPQVPTAPIGLGLTVQDNGIELSWRQVSNAVGYDLLWSLSSGVDTQSNRIAGVTPPYVHAPVANGQTYYYRLRAANAAGYSVLSGEMSATAGLPGSEAVPSEGAVPAEPAGLLMTVGSGQLDLTWQLRQGARGYNLYWATESTPGIPPTIDTQSNRIANILPPYTHIGLINGERYYYRVSAINDSGESPLSPMVSQIPEVLEPGVPSNVTALGGDANIAIRWNRVRDAQSYTLYYQPDGGTVVAVANLTEPLYMINGLANGTLYHLQVSSTHAQSGESPRSEQLTVTPQVDPVSAPVQVQAIPGESQVLVRFDTSAYSSLGAGKAVQSYRLYYSTSPGAQSGTDYISIDAVTITTDTASYLHSGLTNGRRYYYTISAVNAGGESALSREVWAQPQVAVPGAPRNVEVQENDSELTLFWQVPEGAVPTNYNVYWSQTLSNGQRTQPVVIPNVGVEVSAGQYQFTITGLVNNTQYYVQVKAFNDGGEGLSSTELGAIPHIVAPSGVPTSLSAQAQANQVSLSWDWDNATQGSAPPHYRLYWSTQSSTSLQNSAWIDGVQPGYVHQGLTNGQAYYYRVAALNDGGEGPVSTAIQAVPLPDPPGQVNGFQVQGSDAAVVLTWNPVSGADAYNIYWSTNPGLALGSWNKLTGLNPGDQHLSLENGLTYYYVVTAVNLGGESDSSVMLSASPQIPAPSAPQGLAATSDNTQVIVAWETELGLSYNLYWVNNAVDDPYTQGQVISNIRPAYLHSGLVNNTVYRYVVTAVNAGGESAPSQVVRATPQALQTGAPAALVAVAADTQVTLSWQAAPSATVNTRYTLYVSDSPGTGTAGTAIPNVISPYIHTGLNNGTQYYYVVTAIEDVESAASNEATAMPMPPEPSVPVGLAAIGGDTVVTLSWSASENANAYTLFWDTVADFSSAASIPLGNVLAYRHSGLSNGVTYYYRLRAHNGPSSSAFGYTVSTVTVAPVVNTAPLVQIDNPAADISIIVGQSVNFQSTASDAEDDADGRALAYQWDFGSNSGLTSSQVADPGPRRFQTPGGYTVSLTVTDSGGLSTTVTRVVNVLLNSEPNGTILLPTQNVLINTGESVNFSGQGLDPDNHNPLSYSWRFGNNSGIADSNLADPGLKTFNYPGIHIVRFTVSDALGLSDSTPAVITVQVNAPPLVQIDSPAQDLAISQGQSVDFQATASDPEDGRNGLSFLWNFGTGSGLSPSTQEDPGALVFNNIGTHQVTLIVTDQYGAQSRVSRSVSVDGVNQNPTINSPTMVEGVYAVSMDEDGSPVAFTPININATDPEAQNLSWRIAPLPSPQPQLGTPSFSNTTANGSSTTLNYAVNTDANGVDQFDVEVQDGFGGRALLRIEVNISAQNDQPSITTNQLTINEGQTLVLNSVASALNLEADDVDNTAAQLIYNIVSVGSGQFETVSAPGTAVTSFTHQQVLDQQVQFVHNDGDPAPSYSLTIEDSSGIASSESVAQINFTALPDTTPDPFSFIDQAGATVNTFYTSSITVTGINRSVPISISGGEYAIDGGAFTSLAGNISNGQTVAVRLLSPATLSATTNAVLSIGGVSDTFSVSTLAADTTPDVFTFTSQTNAPLDSAVVSNAITVNGINTATSISITGGEYSIGGAAYTSAMGTVNNGQSVTVRLTSSAAPSTTTTATLSIGGVDGIFSVTTSVSDSIPDAFGFTSQTGVELNTQVVSNAITVSGINVAVPISIAGGQYSVDGGAFTTVAGTITNGQTVAVRLTSAAVTLTDTTATITIGGVGATFTATTGDNTPNAFGFPTQTGIELNTQVVSNAITVTGIDITAPISIAGGQYAIDGGAFTTVVGTITSGQTVTVRLTSASVPLTDTTTTLTIGGVSGTFTATTGNNTPNAFGFITQTGIELNTQVVSNAITVTGIDITAPISIAGGQYAIDGGAFTTVAGTITSGQTVVVRLTSASVPLTDTTTTLTIGGVSGTFTATTGNNTPNAFGFTTQTGIELNTQVVSNATAVTGINIAAPISIAGGQYAINGAAFTTVAGTITNGQTVTVRITSASVPMTDTFATVTIGGVSGTFTATTGDNTPNAFGFTTQTGIELNTQVVSNATAVTGINIAAPISIAGGQYSINGAAFTTVAGTISNGQTVAVRLTSASVPLTDTIATVTIGGVSGTFTAITGNNTPNAFGFTTQTGIELNTQVVSNATAVTGINIAAPISIAGGQYSIDGGAFTTVAGTISNGQTVAVRLTSASVPLTD
ncbi:MAG: fibronectin type III domain-containing protein, partial [Gammaproteobacteria bacterium]|nr:fibronectin type III domain-containing protein [Gammaproteobacteria bacterium]